MGPISSGGPHPVYFPISSPGYDPHGLGVLSVYFISVAGRAAYSPHAKNNSQEVLSRLDNQKGAEEVCKDFTLGNFLQPLFHGLGVVAARNL